VQAWDRYAYVNNNALKYTDPSGHQATDIGSGSSSGTGGGTSSSQSTVDDDSSGLGLEDTGDGNPTDDDIPWNSIVYELSLDAAAQLIDDLDAFLALLAYFNGAEITKAIAMGVLDLFVTQKASPESFALMTGITVAEAGAVLASAAPIIGIIGIGAAGVGITGLVTSNDLQNLRNGLADMDLDTLGGTVTFKWGLLWDTMTVESSKGSTSFPTENIGFVTSYAPSFLFAWCALHPEYFGPWE